jgi:proteasome lid subunit RPN8/RPN11
MEQIILELPPPAYKAIIGHLLPGNTWNEQAAFVYAKAENRDAGLIISFIEWEPIYPQDFSYHTEFYLELSDNKRAQIIKHAHDLDASLVEWHSHPLLWPAAFSKSDLLGFKEFVPHVIWRLKGSPYAAVVVTPFDFDALAWTESNGEPHQITLIRVGSQELNPTGRTLQTGVTLYAREA